MNVLSFDMAVDAAFPIRLGLDMHLASKERTDSGETAACAECGRAMWMHGTRHDTCEHFAWITKRGITNSDIETLKEILGRSDRPATTLGETWQTTCATALGTEVGPAWVARGQCAALINTAKKRCWTIRKTLHPIRSQIGAGPYVVIREPLEDGTFQIQLDPDNPPVIGHGNTRREAAKHLADQLRAQAILIEKVEGNL